MRSLYNITCTRDSLQSKYLLIFMLMDWRILFFPLITNQKLMIYSFKIISSDLTKYFAVHTDFFFPNSRFTERWTITTKFTVIFEQWSAAITDTWFDLRAIRGLDKRNSDLTLQISCIIHRPLRLFAEYQTVGYSRFLFKIMNNLTLSSGLQNYWKSIKLSKNDYNLSQNPSAFEQLLQQLRFETQQVLKSISITMSTTTC